MLTNKRGKRGIGMGQVNLYKIYAAKRAEFIDKLGTKLLFSKGVKQLSYKEIDTTNLIEIDSVSSFIEHIRHIKESADGTSTELYFRGQETEFRDLNSMFDIMTKYQHYGMCTRLLDLTTNPLVALFLHVKRMV